MTKNNKLISLGVVGSLIFAMTFIMIPVSVDAATYSKVLGNNTLRVGSRGADVLALQNLLASDKDIYPSGLRTSYFGPLTKAAIIQFQLAYGLTADGIAGTITKNKVNSVIEAGGGIEVAATPISYASALVTYVDRRIQLDTNCQAHPNNVTYKDNTGIMIDNRSPEERTVKVGTTFTIKPWGFKIVVLPNVYLSNKTILIDCDQSQNVATVLIQE